VDVLTLVMPSLEVTLFSNKLKKPSPNTNLSITSKLSDSCAAAQSVTLTRCEQKLNQGETVCFRWHHPLRWQRYFSVNWGQLTLSC